MNSRYVILTDAAPKEERNALTNYLKGKSHYWHHFADSWLVVDTKNQWTASSLREAAKLQMPTAHVLVLKVGQPETPSWSGYGPTKIFAWLKSSWLG